MPIIWLALTMQVAVAVQPPSSCTQRCLNPEKCVVLDPGHPSEVNPGTHVQFGTSERDVNWRIAVKLRERLRTDGVEVLMTRTDSLRSMTNRARAEFANCASGVLFLRLHADAGPTRGFAVLHADRAGRAQGVEGPSPEIRAASRRWAETIEQQMRPILAKVGLPSRGLMGESRSAVGSKQGALTGSIFSQRPTVLIEMVVLSQRADAMFIKSEIGERSMVEAIARGVLVGLAAQE